MQSIYREEYKNKKEQIFIQSHLMNSLYIKTTIQINEPWF